MISRGDTHRSNRPKCLRTHVCGLWLLLGDSLTRLVQAACLSTVVVKLACTEDRQHTSDQAEIQCSMHEAVLGAYG